MKDHSQLRYYKSSYSAWVVGSWGGFWSATSVVIGLYEFFVSQYIIKNKLKTQAISGIETL